MATPTAAQHMSQRHQQLQQQQQQQNQSAREADLSAQAALNIEDTPPVHIVQIVPLVQPQSSFPSLLSRPLILLGVGSDENHQAMSRIFPCPLQWPSPWPRCQGSPPNH